MSNENLDSAKDQHWKQYQFIFQNALTVDEKLAAIIREKIASLDLQKEPLSIRYEEVGTHPLQVDVYVEENSGKQSTTDAPAPQQELIYSRSHSPAKTQASSSIKASAATKSSMVPETSVASNEIASDDVQVDSITFRGAVPKPPRPMEPSMVPETLAVSSEIASDDDVQLDSIVFRGAVPKPPRPTEPL